MRFVKTSDYFSNWQEAIEATVEIWGEEHKHHATAGLVLATLIMVPCTLIMCTFGLRPGGDDE